MDEDWNLDNPYQESNFTVKRCEPSDFGEDKQSQAFYDTWVTEKHKFDMFCPDLQK